MNVVEGVGLRPGCPPRASWADTVWEVVDHETGAVLNRGTITMIEDDQTTGRWPLAQPNGPLVTARRSNIERLARLVASLIRARRAFYRRDARGRHCGLDNPTSSRHGVLGETQEG